MRHNTEPKTRLTDDLLNITGIARDKLAVSSALVNLYPLLESTLEIPRNGM